VKISPQDIHRQEFSRGMRGYAMEEVDVFLQRVADEMEKIISDNTKLRDQVKGLESSIADYRRMEKNLERTLMTAQRAADDLKIATEEKQKSLLHEAELRSEEIINEARRQRDELKHEIIALRSQHKGALVNFRAFLETQLRMLNETEDSVFGYSVGETVGEPAVVEPKEPQELMIEPEPGGINLNLNEFEESELPDELDLGQN